MVCHVVKSIAFEVERVALQISEIISKKIIDSIPVNDATPEAIGMMKRVADELSNAFIKYSNELRKDPALLNNIGWSHYDARSKNNLLVDYILAKALKRLNIGRLGGLFSANMAPAKR